MIVEVPRKYEIQTMIDHKTGRSFEGAQQVGIPCNISKDKVYTFCGKSYRIIFSNRGGFDVHHWQESVVGEWDIAYAYDDLIGAGYNFPIQDFTKDDQICQVWMLEVDDRRFSQSPIL